MTENAPAPYGEFINRVERLVSLNQVGTHLYWDEQVMMPEGGTPARSRQRSAVSSLRHELLTDERMETLLNQLDDEELTQTQAANVREVRREYDEATRLPDDLTAEMDRAESAAQPKWRAAREANDYEEFRPALKRVVDLRKKYANHLDSGSPRFEVLFRSGEFSEPHLDFTVAEHVMERLRDELVPLLDRIRESDTDLSLDAFDVRIDTETQMAICRDALDVLEFDWEHGRFDTGPYHFSSGNPWDSRVTTQLHEDDWLGGLMRTLHEFGHTVNTWGLPKDQFGTPICSPVSHAMSESQSRFWENNVGKSRGFWELFLPKLKSRVPQFDDVSVDEAYRAANRILWDNFVRYRADELTYHLHVMVRWDVERELLDGDLDTADIPGRWDEKMEEYLGIRPDTLADGCLQDIHWSVGSISSFQNYTLGSVFAAQLQHAMERDIGDLSDRLAKGDVDVVQQWLHDNLHRHGSRYPTDELIETATGEPFTADYFLTYVTDKYERLYDC
jgi:carboxypeptidase Taq